MNNLPLSLSCCSNDETLMTFFEFIQQCNASMFSNLKYSIVPFRDILQLLNIQVDAFKVPYSSLQFTEVPFMKEPIASSSGGGVTTNILMRTNFSRRPKLGELDVTIYLYQDIASRWLSFDFEYLVDLYDYSTIFIVVQRFSLLIEHFCQVIPFIYF